MEDALLSAESFAILSGANLVSATEQKPIYVHTTSQVEVTSLNEFRLPEHVCWNGGRFGGGQVSGIDYHAEADIFCMKLNKEGEIDVEPRVPAKVAYDGAETIVICAGLEKGDIVFVDYYVKRTGDAQVIEITADKFGGNYYLEASTLFRRESDGVDMPAEFVIPNCKIQSNFTFTMASSGDPSVFNFTLDAFPDYTKFDRTHKVLAAIQVIEDSEGNDEEYRENSDTDNDNDNTVLNVAKNAGATNVNVSRSGNTIYVTGSAEGDEFDADSFNSDGTLDVTGVELNLTIPEFTNGTTVIQTNPGLAYYEGKEGIENIGSTWVKTKTYGAEANDHQYDLLVTDKKGPITVEVRSNTGASLAKYTIINNVQF